MQKITPMLWFDSQAEEAANHYVRIFKDGRIINVARYSEAGPGTPGSVMVVEFELNGQRYTALNGGPHFKFSEAVSFVINCKDQAEVDYFWTALLEGGGKESQCGWLKDKFGFSWQVVPGKALELLQHPDADVRKRVAEAVYKMVKLDLAAIERAARGEAMPAKDAQQTDADVIAYLRDLEHPLKKEIEAVRRMVLGASPAISEGIKWNVPSFRTEKEWFATFNVRAKDSVQLIFHLGAKVRPDQKALKVADPKGLMKWLGKDRAMVTLGAGRDIPANRAAFEAIVRAWVKVV